MINKLKKILFLFFINYSLLGCGTHDIGLNQHDGISNGYLYSFNVVSNSSLIIKNTDIISVFLPTFSCKSTTTSCSKSKQEFIQQQEKIKPYIEKKLEDQGYSIATASTNSKANLFIFLEINLNINPYKHEMKFCNTPSQSPLSFDNINNLDTGPNSICSVSYLDAYAYIYDYTLSIFEKSKGLTPIYQSQITSTATNNTLNEFINKMIDASFTTFPMKGNVKVIFSPELGPINIRFNNHDRFIFKYE